MTESPNPKDRPHKRSLRYFVLGVVLIIPLLVGCNTMAGWLVNRSDRLAPRDPATGILRGAEVKELGPSDAECAVLLVHGFIGGSNNFNDLPETLAAQGWRVRAMLLPGHGTSPRDWAKTTPEQLVVSVKTELDQLRKRHRRVALVGHSMGAALTILASGEANPDALVLAAPYFAVTYHWYYVLPPETWVRLTSPFIRWIYKGKRFMQVNRKEAKDQIFSYPWVPTRGLLTLAAVGRRASTPESLQRITCPVLLLHAEGDLAASPKAARKAFELLGADDKRLVWLPRSNHQIFWDHDCEQVKSEIAEFLRSKLSTPTVSCPRVWTRAMYFASTRLGP